MFLDKPSQKGRIYQQGPTGICIQRKYWMEVYQKRRHMQNPLRFFYMKPGIIGWLVVGCFILRRINSFQVI